MAGGPARQCAEGGDSGERTGHFPAGVGCFPAAAPPRYVAILDKRLHDLGSEADPRLREDLNTRMVLFGAGWSPSRLQPCGVLRPAENSAPGCVSEGS